MKCNHCGAPISELDRKCPYCGSVNRAGNAFFDKVQQMLSHNKKLKKETLKKNRVDIVNGIATRVMAGIIFLFVISTVVSFVSYLALGNGWEFTRPSDSEERMEQLYSQGRYGELHKYMDKYGLFGTDNYKYSQMALYYYEFEDFQIKRDEFIEKYLNHEEMYEWSASYVVSKADDILSMDIGIYDKPDADNMERMQDMASQMEDFLVGWLTVSEEEIEAVKNGAYLDENKIDQWFVENYQWIRE